MPPLEIAPVASRPSSRVYNVRGERSPQRTSFPARDRRESKHLCSPSTLKTLTPNSPFSQEPSEIFFYHSHEPYYGFTNFSNHPVVYKGKKYPTSEHLFQSFKFQDHKPDLAEHIRTCSERPSVAFSEARRFQPEVRPDWKEVNIPIMDTVLKLKFEQHDDLREELLVTGNANLIEDSDKDGFWGIGPDRKGRNELGKALERLRAKLRTSNYRSTSPTYNVQSTMTSPVSNAPQKAESPLQRVQFPGHNAGVQSPVIPSIQPSSDRETRSQVHLTHSPAQNTVRSPTHTSPYPRHNIEPLGYTSQSRIQPGPHIVFGSHASAYNGHLPTQNIQFPMREVQAPEQNRPLTERNSPSTDNSLKSPNYDPIQVETTPADLSFKCRIPDCEKPVYYDGMLKSDYCSQQHRQEAVIRGLVAPCIKCLKMPQSEADYFCGRECKEESLDKSRSKVRGQEGADFHSD